MKKLNIGCGEFPKEGYVNVDYYNRKDVDVICDLEAYPYPWEDNEFDLVEADMVLEHLEDPYKTMREIHRISKPNAIVKIKVPHFSRGFAATQHKRGFNTNFPFYLNPKDKGGYEGAHFECISTKLKWNSSMHTKKLRYSKQTVIVLGVVDRFLNFFANLSPMLCTRVWCFWVGGFEEIDFEFKVVK